MINPWLLIAAWLLLTAVALRLVWQAWERRLVEQRVRAPAEPADVASADRQGFLRRWLFLAGFRGARAPQQFVVSTLVLAGAGGATAWLFLTSPFYAQGLQLLSSLPGGVGEIFLPVFYVGPWVVAVLLVSLPWLIVRRARRNRVAAVEHELPVTLELLATLSEAGLGFDAALSRLWDSQPYESVLSRELRTLQLDVLSGRPRTQCFRRLAARVDVPALSVFVSAVVQAEQVGAPVAGVLRQQSTDLRERRREDAMALAMALPVKRLLPMIVCFLPGIFVATLGPTFYQFFQYADSVLRLQSFGGGP
jgi:tight adherence protein C